MVDQAPQGRHRYHAHRCRCFDVAEVFQLEIRFESVITVGFEMHNHIEPAASDRIFIERLQHLPGVIGTQHHQVAAIFSRAERDTGFGTANKAAAFEQIIAATENRRKSRLC